LKGDYQKNTKDIDNLTPEVKENISSFFANYKNTTPNKWSKVGGFINKSEAVKLYKKTKLKKIN
jgi:inorganic pyrophosphatase